MGDIWLISIQVVHGIFLGIVMTEEEVEDAASDERGDSDTSVEPQVLGVLSNGNESLGDGGTESVGEEVDRLDERLHGRRSLSVGVLETSYRDKDLGNTNEDVGRCLDGDMYVVGQLVAAILASSTLAGCAVTRSSVVDQVLDDSSVSETEGSEPETNGDSRNRSELDAEVTQNGVYDLLNDGSEDQNRDGIKVLHEIVGHSVTLHLTSLSDKVGRELTVANPEDGVEDKDLASTQTTLQLVDEMIVPGDRLGLSVGGTPCRLGSIGVAGGNHHTKSLEGIGDDGTLGRAVDKGLATEDQSDDADVEHDETHEVGSPETLVLLHEGSGHQRQGADVDAPIEDHVDTLVSNGRINDNSLSGLFGSDGHSASLVLVGNKGRDVGLDTTSSQTNNDNSDDVTRLSSTGFHSNRERGSPQDDETNPVEAAEEQNSLVLAEVLIGDDGTKNGSNVAEPLEE